MDLLHCYLLLTSELDKETKAISFILFYKSKNDKFYF